MKRILYRKNQAVISLCTYTSQLFTIVFDFVFQSISQKRIRISFIIIFFLHCCIVQAQNNLWVVGDKLVDFNSSNLITTPVLPQPTVDIAMQPYVYSGQVARNNQYAEFDQNGNLLFFIIDGNIYDNDGYMIADAFDDACEVCFPDNSIAALFEPNTTNNLVVTKVPGHCDKYYLSVYASLSLLDMSLSNHFFPNDDERKGALVPFGAILGGDEEYSGIDFTSFFAQNIPAGVGEINVAAYHVRLPFKRDGGHATNAIYQDIYDDNINGAKYLGIAADGFMTQYELRSDGVFYLNNNSVPGTQGEGWPVFGALEYSKYNDQRMAALSVSVAGNSEFYASSLFVSKLNGDMSFSTTQNFNPHTEGISGQTGDIEFSENGKYLFYTIDVAPYIGVVDIQNDTVIELADLVAIANPSDYIIGRMEMNYYQQVPSIFFITSSGLSILKGCNDLNTAVFIPNAISIDPIPENNFDTSPFNSMYLLPKQSYKHTQIPSMSFEVCCQYFIESDASNGHIVGAGSYTWSYGLDNNPWDATGPVYLMGDLVFNAGSNITIDGMEFRFGPEADVIVNVGAFVKLNNNSKWTSYECDGLMWPGVNLMGNPSQAQSSNDNAWTQQGILNINNSTIENARIGVEVGISNLTGGGVLKGYTANFINCQNGVKYQPYSGIQHGVWYNSRWIINTQLKDPIVSPGRMVRMTNMKGNIAFNGCSFLNETPYTVYLMANRGTGIDAINSRFSLSGGSGSYDGHGDNTHTTFYKWRIGIKAINGGTTSFSVQSMYFQECNIGLSANAVNNESIVQNVFTIPSNAYVFAEKPRGVILTGCTGFTFRENDFAGISSNLNFNTTAQNVGAMLVNCGGAQNLGYRNYFQNLWKGEEIQGVNRYDYFGLELRCNTYDGIRYDQYLASNSEWKLNQGDASSMERMANNKFSLYVPNCNSMRFDMYVHPNHNPTYEFDYIRPNNEWYIPNSSSPCNGFNGITPYMQDFCPSQFSNNSNFLFAAICPTMPVLVDPGEGMIFHSDAISNLKQARELYKMVVDGNEKFNIQMEINNAFPMESDLMRNYLLEHSPLSDEIIKEAIDKNGLLDPWHLTQVLLANSPLTKDVLMHIESTNILNSFFLGFLYDAQISGTPNYRKLLEFEIAARESDRHTALSALLDFYNKNSNQVDNTEIIKNIMIVDESISAKFWLVDYFINAGASNEATNMIDEIYNLNGLEDFAELKQMQLSLSNDWSQISPSMILTIENWSNNKQSSAYGASIGVLHELELKNDLPEPEVPAETRYSESILNKTEKMRSVKLASYPNPAMDFTFLSYPREIDGVGILEVYNSMGQLIFEQALNDGGIFELNTLNYADGIYLLSISIDGVSMMDSKLIINR